MNESQKNQKIIDNYDYLKKAASSNDCTGLIPFLPVNKAELDSYSEIYQYLPPEIKNSDHNKKTHNN